MGTRSLTIVNDEHNEKEMMVFYRHYDGYPTGHGTDLLNFLKGKMIVNGLSSENENLNIANGMGCLAAQIVEHFKNGPAYFYLYPSDTRDYGEEYIYTIYTKKDEGLCIKVETTYEDASEEFHGTIAQYEDWINKQHNELEELENGKNE